MMSKKMKALAALTLSLLLLLGTAAALAEPLRFVSITGSSTNTSAINMNSGAKAVFEAAGAQFTAQYYEDDYARMMSMIENAIIAGYDGIILQSTNLQAGSDSVRAAVDAGMIICEYDGDYADIEGIQYHFGGDNYNIGYMCGKMAGEWAEENLAAQGIPVVVGDIEYRELPDFVNRADGIKQGFMDACPQAQFVMEGFEWTTVECMAMVENWLQAYPEMNVVVGFADTMALGAAQAFAAAGKDPTVTAVFGIDCIDEAVNSIADPNGIYKGTVNLDLGATGEKMAQYMLDAANGVVAEGREKYNYFPMSLVTGDNVAEYQK